MVDGTEAGCYWRQNEQRWVTTSLVRYVMEARDGFDQIMDRLHSLEIVNAPDASTHNLIAAPDGRTCLVEPGRKKILSGPRESAWYVMTNFPLSDYDEVVPTAVAGSGADRYCKALELLKTHAGRMTVERGFEILRSVQQTGPEWKTALSLVYDASEHELFYCTERKFNLIAHYDFPAV